MMLNATLTTRVSVGISPFDGIRGFWVVMHPATVGRVKAENDYLTMVKGVFRHGSDRRPFLGWPIENMEKRMVTCCFARNVGLGKRGSAVGGAKLADVAYCNLNKFKVA